MLPEWGHLQLRLLAAQGFAPERMRLERSADLKVAGQTYELTVALPDTGPVTRAGIDALAKTGATRYVVDLRGAVKGDLDDGTAAARLFVKTGPLSVKESKGGTKETVAAQTGDGAITAPVVLIVNQSTARAGEVFAAALAVIFGVTAMRDIQPR